MLIYLKASKGSRFHQVKAKVYAMSLNSPPLPQLYSSSNSQHAHFYHCAHSFMDFLPSTWNVVHQIINMFFLHPSSLHPMSGWIRVKHKLSQTLAEVARTGSNQ